LARIQPAVTREYKRHDRYWINDRPFLDAWHVPIMPEYASRYAQFITGNIHAFTPRATDVLQAMSDAPDARPFQTDPGAGIYMLEFGLKDLERQPYRDERVRQAMSMALDWESIRSHFDNRDEFNAHGLPVESRRHTHVKAGGDGYDYWLDPVRGELGANSKYLLFDLDEAKKLMAAAGYADGIEFNGYSNAGREYGADYADLVQITIDQLARSGLFRVRNHIRNPYPQHLEEIARARQFEGVNIQQPSLTFVEVDLELFNMYHSDGSRPVSLPDRMVDQMVEQQRREPDPEKRTTIIHDLQKYMAKTMPSVPGDGVSSGFTFRWPWLRNISWPVWNWWLSADAPRRDG
jgi:ABC-type transport system substrate-binding protein